MLIDLHCHTAPRSRCSDLAPRELIELARQRGLGAICLTEHDTWWPEDEIAALRAEAGFPVFHGVELTTDMGHILAFGLPPPVAPLATARNVFDHAAAHGGVLFLAHPARDGLLKVTAETVTYFASVEALNGSDSRLQNMAATGLAKGFRLPGIGGSDAHTADEVGRTATSFDVPVHDQAELLAALHAGNYQAVTLE